MSVYTEKLKYILAMDGMSDATKTVFKSMSDLELWRVPGEQIQPMIAELEAMQRDTVFWDAHFPHDVAELAQQLTSGNYPKLQGADVRYAVKKLLLRTNDRGTMRYPDVEELDVVALARESEARLADYSPFWAVYTDIMDAAVLRARSDYVKLVGSEADKAYDKKMTKLRESYDEEYTDIFEVFDRDEFLAMSDDDIHNIAVELNGLESDSEFWSNAQEDELAYFAKILASEQYRTISKNKTLGYNEKSRLLEMDEDGERIADSLGSVDWEARDRYLEMFQGWDGVEYPDDLDLALEYAKTPRTEEEIDRFEEQFIAIRDDDFSENANLNDCAELAAQLSWGGYDTLAASTGLDYFRKSMLLASHADAVAAMDADQIEQLGAYYDALEAGGCDMSDALDEAVRLATANHSEAWRAHFRAHVEIGLEGVDIDTETEAYVAAIEAMIAEGITEPQAAACYTKKVAHMAEQPAVISGPANITSSTLEQNRGVA